MRVLQVCPLWFPVAQDALGGIETFLAYLVRKLEDRDCEVTLLATGDSTAGERILPVVAINLYDQMRNNSAHEYVYYEQQQLQLALKHIEAFDLVHSHIGPAGFVLSGAAGWKHKVLHTIHTPVYKDFQWFVKQQPEMHFSTVSRFQATRLCEQGARNCEAIHNGVDTKAFTFNPEGGEELLFLGRIEWEKGPDIAIKVAQELARPLTLAGPIVQQGYFDDMIAPLLDDTVRYVGVLNHEEKNEALGNAGCVLMPSRWDEPFGMVAIEAMACGTPVVVSHHGALPEIVEDGVSGFVALEDDMSDKVLQALKLDRAAVRGAAVVAFDVSAIAGQYVESYRSMLTL